jgi:RHS repeat-associated protein
MKEGSYAGMTSFRRIVLVFVHAVLSMVLIGSASRLQAEPSAATYDYVDSYNVLVRMLHDRETAASRRHYVSYKQTGQHVAQSDLNGIRNGILALISGPYIHESAFDPSRQSRYDAFPFRADAFMAGVGNGTEFTRLPAVMNAGKALFSNNFTDVPVLTIHLKELGTVLTRMRYTRFDGLEWATVSSQWSGAGASPSWDVFKASCEAYLATHIRTNKSNPSIGSVCDKWDHRYSDDPGYGGNVGWSISSARLPFAPPLSTGISPDFPRTVNYYAYGAFNGEWYPQSSLEENTWNRWSSESGQGASSEAPDRIGEDRVIWCDEPELGGPYSSLGYGASDSLAVIEWKDLFLQTPADPSDLPNEIDPDAPNANVIDPINTINGNVSVHATDISIPCPGLPLEFRRSYNSMAGYDGPLGPRWTHSFNISLFGTNSVFNGATNTWRMLRTGDGNQHAFRANTNGSFSSPTTLNWHLAATNGGFVVTMPGPVLYTFNSNGVLQAIGDGWRNTLAMTYTNDFPGHQLIRVEHANGQALSFTYGQHGLGEVLSPSADLHMSFGYNAGGEMATATRHVGTDTFTTEYTYDPDFNHNLVSLRNPAGHLTRWTYEADALGHATSRAIESSVENGYYHGTVIAGTNNTTTVTYTQRGTNVVYEHHYHPVLNMITDIRGPNPPATSWGLTGRGTRMEHDYDGNEIRRTLYDNGRNEFLVTARGYDACHHVTNEAVGLNAEPAASWSYGWDTNASLLTSITDPAGHHTEFDYTNGLPRRTRIHDDAGTYHETTFSYTRDGQLASVTNANGHGASYAYDRYGHLASVTPALGPVAVYSNSVLGHLLRATLPGEDGDRVTTFEPDELGQVHRVTYPDSRSESFSYDAIGNLTNHIDAAGRSTRYSYLPTRKLHSVTRTFGGDSSTVRYDYDQQFNTLGITDPAGRLVESYVLDDQDRPILVSNVEHQVMSIAYGVGDFVRTVTNFDGTVIQNEYDGQGFLATQSTGGDTNAFTYYRDGSMESASNVEGCISNRFNQANRLVYAESLAPSGSVAYAYLPAGNIASSTSVAGSMNYSYDAAERLSSLSSPTARFAYSYHANNGLVSTVSAASAPIAASYSYDVMDRVTGITWSQGGTNVLQSFAYVYSAAGLITNVVMGTGETLRYQYDYLDRLTGETRTDDRTAEQLHASTFSYDPAGNRTQAADAGVTLAYAYQFNRLTGWSSGFAGGAFAAIDVAGQSTETIGQNPFLGQLWVSNTVVRTPRVSGRNFIAYSVPVAAGQQEVVAAISDTAGNVTLATNRITAAVVTNATYAYNAAGCLTNICYNGVGATQSVGIVWNSRYQVTAVATNGATAESYGYDALGRCAYTVSAGSTNWYVYDGAHVVAETDGRGVLRKSYAWGPGIDNLLSFTIHAATATNTYYCLTDHLRTVHAVADSTGAIVETYRYDAWGKVLGVYDAAGQPLEESALGNNTLFQGRWYSWTTRLYNFRARWYDPVTGRWLSNDPIGISGGLNQYAFCGNNPVNRIDPFGLDWFGGGDDGWSLGRDSKYSPIRPGEGLGAVLETYVPAMERMSIMHDSLVGALVPDTPVVGPIVDLFVNVPTMPVVYAAGVAYETGCTFIDVGEGIGKCIVRVGKGFVGLFKKSKKDRKACN